VSVIKFDESKCAKADTILKILESDNLNAPEETILEFALTWAEHECKRQNLELCDRNKRRVLGLGFYQIRFVAFSATALSELVHSGLLTQQESVDIKSHEEIPSGSGMGNVDGQRMDPFNRFNSTKRTFINSIEDRLEWDMWEPKK